MLSCKRCCGFVASSHREIDRVYWNIHANDFGYAEITIHYTKLDNSPGSFTFPVWVNEDVYEMWIDSSTGTENILPGGEMNLIAYMNHYAFDQEEEYLPGDLKDRVTLCWDYKDQKQNRDVLTITQDMEDQRICHIAVKDNITDDLDIHLVLHAYEKDDTSKDGIAKDGEGNPIELASGEFCVCVRQEYYIVEPQGLYNLDVGESVSVTPQLKCYNLEYRNGTVVSELQDENSNTYNVEYLWEYDEAQIEVTENENGTYTVTRKNNDEISFNLLAGHYRNDEEPYFKEYTRSSYF